MQESGGDSVAIYIYIKSSPSHPLSPSLISLMVSEDVKHCVYLLFPKLLLWTHGTTTAIVLIAVVVP